MKHIFKIELDPNRVFGLDLLRALAILFVVIGHGIHLLPANLIKLSSFFVWDGVSIFFVLSGFLIGGILIKIIDKNKITPSLLIDFWKRRWFRTLPNYLLILVLLALLNYFFTSDFTFSSIYKYFIFSQNLFQRHPDFFSEAWSLSIEEWFYLTVPVLIATFVWIGKVKPRQAVLISAVIIISLVTAFRWYRHSTIPLDDNFHWDLLFRKQVSTRLDSLMFGVIGAYINFYHFSTWVKNKRLMLLIGLFLFVLTRYVFPNITALTSLYSTVFSFSLVSIATLLLLPFLSTLKKGTGILYKPITYISLTSYSIYLLNFTLVQKWIINKIAWNEFISNAYAAQLIQYAVFWFLVITLSILLYKYFEVPMTKLRDNKKIKPADK